ncbi:MAG TPA: glycosyltransferase family 39 protein [Xanthomonadaceae bacterium]|nr:glycosyltransferase family 39 protein [Xanthomonadaceae bacterium]
MTRTLRSALPPLLLVFLLALAFVLPFQGTRHLWGTDEGRYSAVALEMLDSGDWLVPHRHPEHEHLSKPPMTYWALAVSMAAFGKNTWALRLPSALAFAMTIACVFAMGRRIVPERPWWPPLVCAGTAMIFLAANAISTDPLLCAFESLGMTGYVLAWRGEDERTARRGAWILGLGFGLAFLTKGPPGLVPLIPSIWYWARNRKDFRANPFTWTTLAIWAPIALTWFLAVVWNHPERLNYFLGYETYGRIFTRQADRHPQWYGWFVAYGPVALVGALPWTLVIAWDAWRRRGQPKPEAADADRKASRFLLSWLLVSLVVFCVSRSRLTLYVLPLLVPFGLWAALRTRHLALGRTGRILLTLWFAFLLAVKIALPLTHSPQLTGKDSRLLSDAIRAQVHEPFREIVFVDETALYGLRVYLGTPVLRVDFGETTKPDVDLTLAQALAQHRPQRLWLVHMHTADNFVFEVEHAGERARQVASFAHYRCFVVDQPAPVPAATPAPIGQLTPVPPSPQ